MLWGSGSIGEAARWFAQHQPEPDTCDPLDRRFMIRYDEPRLYIPMRPTTIPLPDDQQIGVWYLVKADHPDDAYHHVRTSLTTSRCADRGPCHQCHAETIHTGHYQQFIELLAQASQESPPLPPDVASPWVHPRYHQINNCHGG